VAQPYQLVIDLGTCHTVAVIRRAGQTPRPLLFDGSPLLPSGAYRDAGGGLSVGRDAERLSLLDPSRFEPYPKRCVDDGSVLLGDAPVPVVELLAALLRRVLAEASSADGTPREVTLTCPADWGPQRREVLRAAARSAGLPEVRLVDEPIAAASYCVEALGQPIPPGRGMLVFDFGGGTLDVTVVRHDPDGLRVAALGGLDDLGGVDIDAALVGHLGQLVALRRPQLWQRLVDPQSTGEQRDRRMFWNEVRAAKEMLSRTPSAPVQIPGGEDALHLTREELERVAGPLIDRAVDEARRVVDRAGLPPGGLAGILLVGGSSRIPLAASRLHARFGVAPTVPEQPELPVAFGALLVPPVPPPSSTPPWVTPPPRPGETPGAPVSALPYRISPVSGPIWAPQGPPPSPAGPAVPMPVSPGRFPAPEPAPFASAQPGQLRPPQPGRITGPQASAIPGAQQGQMVPPQGGAAAAQAGRIAYPPPVGWTPPVGTPDPVVAPDMGRRRSGVRALVVAGMVLVLVGALGWGGTKLFGAVADKVGGRPGDSGSSAGGGPLQRVGSPIDLSGVSGAVALTASGIGVFYSTTTSGKTTVHGLDPTLGQEMWTKDLDVEPAEASLRIVGQYVVLDAKGSATDGGKDIRVVLDPNNGTQKQKLDWTQRADVAYLGVDAIVATTWEPYRTLRVNLVTGKQAWESQPIGSINAWHPVKPELTWKAEPAALPVNVPAPQDGFAESFGVNPDRVVQLDASGGKAQVVDGAGKVTVSGRVTIDDDLNHDVWTAYDGLLIGAVTDSGSGGRGEVTAYRLSDLKPAWSAPVAFSAGDDVTYVHPCGEHLVCVKYDKNTTDTKAVVAIDTASGKRLDWTSMPAAQFGDFSTEPYWLLLGGNVVYGESSFPPEIGCQDTGIEVVDANNGATVHTLASPARTTSAEVIGAAGRYAAIRTLKLNGSKIIWQVSLLDVVTGKQTQTMDIGSGDNPPQQAVIAGQAVAVIGADHKLYIAQAPNLPA
jgi:molecular chaperone HscA